MSWEDVLKKDESFYYEHEAIKEAQKIANETGKTQYVIGIVHMEEDGYREVEHKISEEEVPEGNWVYNVATIEPKIQKGIRREQRKRFRVTDYDAQLKEKGEKLGKTMREIERELMLLSRERNSATTPEEEEEISRKIEETSKKLREIRRKMADVSTKIIIRRRGSRDSE